ncbi:MAG: hypothetical protein E7382_02605 [Clostridiales bacterium]|nr:hypothetical protein [Clostridiales bacterium]
MKGLKKIFINLIVVVMLVSACFAFAGCKDVREMELTVSVYNNETDETEEVTLTVELYGHLAKETVDAIEGYINDGYYDDAIFYLFGDGSYMKQLMVGDLKYSAENGIVQNDIKPELDKAEFTRGGTKGSNLTSEKGAIGLWRTWYASDNEYRTNSNALTSGRATWYIPTSTISSYNDWFCVFAQIDFEEEGNEDALNKIIKGCDREDADFTEYVIYYTGEYDETKADQNHGLTFNCVEKADYQEDEIDDLFVAEGEQYVCYNKTNIKVPVVLTTGEPAVKIISAKMA